MGTRNVSRLFGFIRDRFRWVKLGYGIHLLEFHLISKKDTDNATEYFCCSCRQLRLDMREDRSHCGNCMSKDIIVGPTGTLDKAALIRKLDGHTQ